MADPLSATASIIAIIQISSQVLSHCYLFLKEANNASKDIAMIISQVGSVESTLRALDHLGAAANLDAAGSQLSILDELRKKGGPFETCLSLLKDLEEKLRPASGFKKVSRAMTWPLKEKETRKTLDAIERHKSTFTLALTGDSARLISRLQVNVADLHGTVQNMERLQMSLYDKSILQWLSPADYLSSHDAARKKHEPTTGAWLLQSDEFLNWRQNHNPSMWLHGIPGCGKTILCSTIIDHVISLCNAAPGFQCAYFYFEFDDLQKQTASSFLSTIIVQLIYQRPCMPEVMQRLYSQHGNGCQQAGLSSLISTILSLIQESDQVFLVIDALDECSERETVLNLIQQFMSKEQNITLLVTSRNERDIEIGLKDVVTNTLPIQSAAVNSDIGLYVHNCIASDQKLKRWSQNVREEIEITLTKGAEGMFRWVVCQLDDLRTCLKISVLKTKLQQLPKSLEKTYERILTSIPKEYIAEARSALWCLAFAVRPLTMQELAEAAVIKRESESFDPEERLSNTSDILEICSSLVTVYNRKDEIHGTYSVVEEDIHVRLAHYSVLEYLMSEGTQTGPASAFYSSVFHGHHFLAEICIVYLQSPRERDTTRAQYRMLWPFAEYSAASWHIHYRYILDYADGTQLTTKVKTFFDPIHTCGYDTWLWLHGPESHHPLHFENADPLYYASALGLYDIVVHLIEQGAEIVPGSCGVHGNALKVAAYGGHLSIVKLLLERGSDVHVLGGRNGTALQAAAFKGDVKIVSLLIDYNAHINDHGGESGTALQAAALAGSDTVVRLLLEKGAHINAPGGEKGTALRAAAWNGHDSVVKVLLEHGADVNAYIKTYGSALEAAAHNGHKIIVKLLIEHGADINAAAGKFSTALQAAVNQGDEEMVRFLLWHGADINAKAGFSGTALQAAVWQGRVSIVKLLIEQGAEINIRGGFHGSALEAAAWANREAILKLLLEEGANVDIENGNYSRLLEAAVVSGNETIVKILLQQVAHQNLHEDHYILALHESAKKGNEKVARLLLERGVNVNAQGGKFGYALQAAVWEGHKAFVEMLLAEGADVNTQGGRHGTALQAAACLGHETLVRLLLQHGAEINVQAGLFGNALQAATTSGYNETVNLLLKEGANVNALGGALGTALQAACCFSYSMVTRRLLLEDATELYVDMKYWGTVRGGIDTAKLLLQHGADVNLQGGFFGNALQAACFAGWKHAVRLLLERGAEVNAQGGYFGTALQAACWEGYEVIIQLLLEQGADVNVRGGRYGTVLQAATAIEHGAIKKVQMIKPIVKRLLEHGAEVNARGGIFGSALQAIVWEDDQATALLLIERGADVNIQCGKYGTALKAAASAGSLEMVKLLLECGAAINVKGGLYGTALQAAASIEKGTTKELQMIEPIVRLLLEHGADVNVQGGYFGNALQAAAFEGDEVVVEILLDHGAEVNAEGGQHETALKAATLADHKAIQKLLRHRGARD